MWYKPYFSAYKMHQTIRHTWVLEEKIGKKICSTTAPALSKPGKLHSDHKMHPHFPPKFGGASYTLKNMVHIMEHYSNLRNKEIITLVITWVNLGDIMLSEINQSQKGKQCMILFV